MLETFKTRLKAKLTDFKAQNLTQKRIDAIADRLHKRQPDLTDEAEHDKAINDLNDLMPFEDIAKEDDRVRTLESKAKDPKPTDPKPADPKPTDEEPAWFKAYRESTDAKLSAFEKEKTQGSIKQQLAEKLKDVPQSMWSKRALPETPEAIEAFVTEVQADYKTDFIDKGLVTITPAGGTGGASSKMSKEQVKSLNDTLVPKP